MSRRLRQAQLRSEVVTLWDGFRYQVRDGKVFGQIKRDSDKMGIVDDAERIHEVKEAVKAAERKRRQA